MNDESNQDRFYSEIIETNKPVNVFLVNGVRLFGQVISQDQYTITLSSNKSGHAQLVYKHAISTVQSMLD